MQTVIFFARGEVNGVHFAKEKVNLPYAVYQFSELDHILQLRFLNYRFCLLLLFCREVDETTERDIAQLKRGIANTHLAVVCAREEWQQARRAFCAGADDFFVLHTLAEVEAYIVNFWEEQERQSSNLFEPAFIHESDFMLREHLLSDLITKNRKSEWNFNRRIESVGWKDYTDFLICVVRLDTGIEDAAQTDFPLFMDAHAEILSQYIDERCNVYVSDIPVVFLKREEELCILFYWQNNRDMSQQYRLRLTRLFEDSIQWFSTYTGHSCTMGVGSPYNDLRLTREAYEQAKMALYQRFYGECGQLYFYHYRLLPDTTSVMELEKDDELEALVQYGDRERLSGFYEDVCASLRTYHASYTAVVSYLTSAAGRFVHFAGQAGISLEEEVAETVTLTERLNRLSTFEQMKACFLQNMQEKIAAYYTARNQGGSVVEQAVAYIDSHLGEELSLTGMAARVHLNANYFSELFKKKMKQNFLEYVTARRMERACYLLNGTQESVYMIGLQVGYREVGSFNRNFKKICGLTPSQYRKKIHSSLTE